MKRQIVSLILVCSLSLLMGRAQNSLYSPRFVNYQTIDIGAESQKWSITQDKEGRLFFANTKGLIEFDGYNWKLYPLPKNKIIKSVYYSEDERLYIGAFEEFGYFTRTEYNTLEYHSLKPLVDYEFQNDEIWNIIPNNDNVYFQYFSSLFVYNGKTVYTFNNLTPLNIFEYNGELYSQIIDNGFCKLLNGQYEQIIERKAYANDDIVALCPFGQDEALLVTRNQGIFKFYTKQNTIEKWDNEIDDELKNVSCNRAILTKDSTLVIGTLTNGIYALDKSGQLLWNINTKSGLNNNTVLALFCDLNNNIWAGLDNGIAHIHHNSSISMFVPNMHNIGMIYDVLFKGNDTYMATNQGLYYNRNKSNKSELIPGTEGQTWSITQIDNQLICGHNAGSFEIEKGKIIEKLSSITGANNIIRCTIHGQDVLLQSSYTFLSIYKKGVDEKWAYSNIIDNFTHPIKNIELDHLDNIWVKHRYKGVYKIKLNKSLTKVTNIVSYKELDSAENKDIKLHKISGRVVFSNENGFYTYDDLNDSIIPYEQMNTDIPQFKDCYRIVKQADAKYWYINDKYSSLVEYKNGKFQVVYQIPWNMFDNPPNKGTGDAFNGKDGGMYFTLNGSLVHYNSNKSKYQDPHLPKIYLKEVMFFKTIDKTTNVLKKLDENSTLEYDYNNIKLAFYVSHLKDKIYEIYYRMEGLDKKEVWHDDIEKLEKTYPRLPSGEYIFTAILKEEGREVSRVDYTFSIKPPFYMSHFAIVCYALLMILLIIGIIWIILKKMNKRKNKEIEQQQQQIIKLENERLEAEIKFKGKELSNFAMQSIKNKEFLKYIKEELQTQSIKNQSQRKFYASLTHYIDEYIDSEDDWTIFQTNFDYIHNNFFSILKASYSEITYNDLKLCALLRLNLSSKDIANMLNISLRGIEAARYRLRKKLNLSTEQDLTEFLSQIKCDI